MKKIAKILRMDPLKRKMVFIFFLLLFFIIGSFLTLYSFGYRIDWKKRKITPTGGIFVKVIPKGVAIFLDGNFVKKTDFVFGSALIENLLPKKYKIRIEKPSYLPWQKELEVNEKMVTEIKNLVLFPENLKFLVISKNIENFWHSPDGKKIILKEKEEGEFSFKLFSLEKNIKSHLIKASELLGREDIFLDLNFKSNQEIEVLLKTPKKVKILSADLTRSSFQLIEKEKNLPSHVLCFLNDGGNVYFFEKDGYLYLGNTRFEKIEKKNEEPLKIEGEKDCLLEVFKNFFFFLSQGNLYLLNAENKKFEKVFEGVKGIVVSPDHHKVAIFLRSEIWIFFEDGKKVFLNRFGGKISQLSWLNADYLIFSVDEKIKISEIDTRDKVNTFEIREFKGEKFFFSSFDKRIYFLENNNLYQSDPLELF